MHRTALLAFLLLASTANATVTVTVDTFVDAPDASPIDGACVTAAGECSLRAALQFVDELQPDASGDVDIEVPPGIYTLTHQAGDAAIEPTTGDLDLTLPTGITQVNLLGLGLPAPDGTMARAVIEAAPGFRRRLLRVAMTEPGQHVRLLGFELRDAVAVGPPGAASGDAGAAIQCVASFPSLLTLNRVWIHDNQTTAQAGALAAQGCSVTAERLHVEGNCGAIAAIRLSGTLGGVTRSYRFANSSIVANTTACFAPAFPQHHALALFSTNAAEEWSFEAENVSLGENIGAMLLSAPITAASTLRSVRLRNVTFAQNAQGSLGNDGLNVSGDVDVEISHSTLGDMPGTVNGGARVRSLGATRAGFVENGGTWEPHATDLPLTTASLLDWRKALDQFTDGYPLLIASPLIDAGTATASMSDWSHCAPEDQADATRPSGTHCDIGALEFIEARVFGNGFE